MQGDSRQHVSRGDRLYRHTGAIAGLVATALLAFATPASATTDGEVRFVRNVTSSATSQLLAAEDDPARQAFWDDRYWRVRGYAPYYDNHTFSGSPAWTPPPTDFYRDLYAIYNKPAGEALIAEHPDWVLRDSEGQKLYLQYGCAAGSCPQYAADIGNPAWRAHWIANARETLSRGYSGIHIDDVNLSMRVSDGSGTFTHPIDPRTGAPMSDSDWRRYIAEFTEAVRVAFPETDIAHNVYWREHSARTADPYALRELAAADTIEVERGFNDSGLVGGTGPFGYETLLGHVQWLHSRGLSVVYEPYGLDATSAEFELASYYLVKDGEDSITSGFQADPDAWWSGWETDLGTPSGARYAWNGLFRRDFANGMVLTNQPGAATKTVTLPGGSAWTSLNGSGTTSVTLAARRGKVLLKQPTTPPPPPPPDTTPPETTITSGPSGTITSTSASFGLSSSQSVSTFECRLDAGSWASCTSPRSYADLALGSHTFEARASDATGNVDPSPATRTFAVLAPPDGGEVTIKPKKPKVPRGGAIVLTGTAEATSTVQISARRRGGWRALAPSVAVVDGAFRVALRARRAGTHRFRASVPGLGESAVARVRVKA